MKVELLEKLLDAGFSKNEIIELARDQPITQDPEPAKEPEPEKKEPEPEPEKKELEPEPEKKEPEKKDPEPEDTTGKRLDSIEQSIAKLIKTIQSGNVKKDSFGAGQDSLEEQTDRIMASIIRPEKKKGE